MDACMTRVIGKKINTGVPLRHTEYAPPRKGVHKDILTELGLVLRTVTVKELQGKALLTDTM
jgi:hypothetical protein